MELGTLSGGRMASSARLSGSSSTFSSVTIASACCFFSSARRAHSFPVGHRPPLCPPRASSQPRRAKKRNSYFEPVLKQAPAGGVDQGEQVVVDDGGNEEEDEDEDDDDDDIIDELEVEMLVDEDVDFKDDYEAEDMDPYVGDGAAGGGVALAGTWWDKEALALAEDVSKLFNGDLKIYAFKTYANSVVRVRIEKLSSKYGSPSMTDIEDFSSAYQARLDEAERAGTIPDNISLEVSSPGVERVVRIPEDLERFKDRPMYVKYAKEVGETDPSQDSDGVFRLVSFDMESGSCTWGIADVRINREKAGKGRPLSKKQREWRLQTSFDSLLLIRLYSEC